MTTALTLATWNVNSLRARWHRFVPWLNQHTPDVVCLQEIKVETALFPMLEINQLGYHALCVGQKTYNGVALLVRHEHGQPTLIADRLGTEASGEARFVHAFLPQLSLSVASVYVPNGDVVTSTKFDFKQRWLDAFLLHADRESLSGSNTIVAGDFNIAPDDRDVYDPVGWQESVICHTAVRDRWRSVLEQGFVDALREKTQEGGLYTYWDYRDLGFPKNHGLRIDHALVSTALRGRIESAWVDREMRKGEKPSDHVPFFIKLTHR